MVSRANVRAEDSAGAREGVLIVYNTCYKQCHAVNKVNFKIYKVNFSFKVFAIFSEKRLIMWTAKGGKVLRRGAENGESQGVA